METVDPHWKRLGEVDQISWNWYAMPGLAKNCTGSSNH